MLSFSVLYSVIPQSSGAAVLVCAALRPAARVGDRERSVYDAHSLTHCIRSVDFTTLTALSPLDGRYAQKAAPLRDYLSEYALIRYRVLIEVRWLQHLADQPDVPELGPLDAPVKDVLNSVVDHFGHEDARRVKELESE